MWTTLSFFIVSLMLFGPKIIYKSVERWTSGMVVVAVVGLLILAVILRKPELWVSVAQGMLNVGYKEESVSYPQFFSWIVFAGAGGTANLFFSFYLRDKNMGMGARIPVLTNILRDREQRDSLTGFRFPDTEESLWEWRRWWRHAVKEQLLFFWFLNTFTILLFIFGSLAVVHPMTRSGLVEWEGLRAFYQGKEISFLALEAVALGSVHPFLTTLFLLVAVATLLSTQLTLVDGVSRSVSDIIHTNFASARSRPIGFWYAVVAGAWIFLGCFLSYVLETSTRAQSFLFLTGFSGGIAMAIYCPLTIVLNRRFLPAIARPGRWMTGFMGIASLFYMGYAVYSIITFLQERLS
jgi:hypothetical protein